MESRARLDYVLFHLTPTRTRCEIVIFAGKSNEKLAYGLLEPFIAHLRSAKDQISKGGYSVTLRPPFSENSHWFTKATLQRFVRFVSTPEVLERFVMIEREISQLENSIKSFQTSNADAKTEGNGAGGDSKTSVVSSKSYGESNDSGDLEQEENSKARLHRVVETRKVVLRKDQAMVYARALAAGFEMDNLNELLLFSDAFGASRLREACIDFRDLCKKKNEDRLWVDEIAAMQAIIQPDLTFIGTSGIILAGEDNDPLTVVKPNGSTVNSTSDSIISYGNSDANQGQMQNAWLNQLPPHLRNFQGPMFQQVPPYQGYGFPGMQVVPPYHPASMPWPSDVNGSADRGSHERREGKSSSKKKNKASKARNSENEDYDGNTDPSDSSSGTDSSSDRSQRKKSGKKSSRKVVIRNINYITSKRDGDKNSSSEIDSSDENHHKSTSRHHRKHIKSKHSSAFNNSADQNGNKGNESWDALQQLLLKEDSDSNVPEAKTVPVKEEYLPAKTPEEKNSPAFMPDAFLVTETGTQSNGCAGEHIEVYHQVIRRGITPEEFLFSQKSVEPEIDTRVSLSDNAARSSVIRRHASDDWFGSKQSDEVIKQGGISDFRIIDGDYVTSSTDKVEKRNKDSFIDDSLMILGRITENHSDGQLRTDISMVSDIIEGSVMDKQAIEAVQQKTSESQGFCEPDELYMVLDRDAVMEQTVPSWNPEIDFENNAVNNPTEKSNTNASAVVNPNEKGLNKKTGVPATKTTSRDARSRTGGGPMRRGKPETTQGPRRSTFGSKTTSPKSQSEKDEERKKRMEALLIRRQKRIAERCSLISDKLTRQPSTEDLKKPKPILRSSTIDRLSVAKKTPNSPTSHAKREASKLKKKSADVKTASQKTRDVHPKNSNTNKIKPSEKKPRKKNHTGASSRLTDVKEVKSSEKIDVDDSKDIKELHVTSSIIDKEVNMVVQKSPKDEKVVNPLEDHSTVSDSIKNQDNKIRTKSLSFPEEITGSDAHEKISPGLSIHPVPESPIKDRSSDLTVEGKSVRNGNIPDSPEVSVIKESTPPATNETVLESIQSRKKWNGPENSPKSVKGFRKLLMFGRKT